MPPRVALLTSLTNAQAPVTNPQTGGAIPSRNSGIQYRNSSSMELASVAPGYIFLGMVHQTG